MNVEWHLTSSVTRRFVVSIFGVAVVEAALSVLIAATVGWWLLAPVAVLIWLVPYRIREVHVIELLHRERVHVLRDAVPWAIRPLMLLEVAGAPIRLLRVAVLGLEPADIVAPYRLRIDGRRICIMPPAWMANP